MTFAKFESRPYYLDWLFCQQSLSYIVATGSFTKKVVCYSNTNQIYILINKLVSVEYQVPKLVFVEYKLDILGTVTLVSNCVYCPVYA